MQTHPLIIWRHGRLLGFFETDAPGARESAEQMLQRLLASEGYRVQVQAADAGHADPSALVGGRA